MVYYHRIGMHQRIDVAKSNSTKKMHKLHYWFFNHGFKFQDSVCNGCQDSTMLCLDISNIVIVTIKGVDYRFINHDIRKSKATHLLEISVLEDCEYIQNACQRIQLFISAQ